MLLVFAQLINIYMILYNYLLAWLSLDSNVSLHLRGTFGVSRVYIGEDIHLSFKRGLNKVSSGTSLN